MAQLQLQSTHWLADYRYILWIPFVGGCHSRILAYARSSYRTALLVDVNALYSESLPLRSACDFTVFWVPFLRCLGGFLMVSASGIGYPLDGVVSYVSQFLIFWLVSRVRVFLLIPPPVFI